MKSLSPETHCAESIFRTLVMLTLQINIKAELNMTQTLKARNN